VRDWKSIDLSTASETGFVVYDMSVFDLPSFQFFSRPFLFNFSPSTGCLKARNPLLMESMMQSFLVLD